MFKTASKRAIQKKAASTGDKSRKFQKNHSKKYSDNYLKTSGSLCHYYRDEPSLNNAGIDFATANRNNK